MTSPSVVSSAIGLIASAVLAVPVLGQAEGKMLIDRDPVFPSGGSGVPMIRSHGMQLEVDAKDPGGDVAPPPEAVVVGTPTPGPVLTILPTNTFGGVSISQVPSFDVGASTLTYKPPDTHHAVGPGAGAVGRIVLVTNSGVKIFDKLGAVVAAQLDLDAFLAGLGAPGMSALGAGNFGFDPKVIYDQHSGRFFIVILDGRTPSDGAVPRSNLQICTSKSSTPGSLGPADWTLEGASALTTYAGGAAWFDYPGIGADATRLVVTGNMFTGGGSGVGTKVRVFLKSSLTDDGVPAGATFNDIDVDATSASGGGGGGYFTAQPAHVYGATLNGDFYLVNRWGSTRYRIWQITGAAPGASLVDDGAGDGPTWELWSAGLGVGAGAPQITDGFNDDPTISTLSSRIMDAQYRNDAGNTDSIWLCLSADPDSDGQTEVVWFEIDPNSGDLAVPGALTASTIVQSGFIDGTTAADWTYMPSIAVNGSGDAMICYSESNSAKAVEKWAASRFVSDTLGAFQMPTLVLAGVGEYDDFLGTDPERWGDYSGCVVDPDGGEETFWISGEVCDIAATAAGDDASWGTCIAEMGAVTPVELLEFTIE